MKRLPRMLMVALGMAGMLAVSTIALATPASADARNCRASHKNSAGYGSSTCLTVYGTSLFVRETSVGHHHSGSWGSICGYKADNWGTLRSGASFYKVSPTTSGCLPWGAEPLVRLQILQEFKDGSLYYGQFYHNGSWTAGVPSIRIER